MPYHSAGICTNTNHVNFRVHGFNSSEYGHPLLQGKFGLEKKICDASNSLAGRREIPSLRYHRKNDRVVQSKYQYRVECHRICQLLYLMCIVGGYCAEWLPLTHLIIQARRNFSFHLCARLSRWFGFYFGIILCLPVLPLTGPLFICLGALCWQGSSYWSQPGVILGFPASIPQRHIIPRAWYPISLCFWSFWNHIS